MTKAKEYTLELTPADAIQADCDVKATNIILHGLTPEHSKLNANYELKCVKCNGCMLSDNHDLPTGRTFTIVGNACPLTKITTTNEVPLRKPTALENETPKLVVTLVYSRKPRKSKINVPVCKSKVLKSVSANKKEPSQSWGSIVSDVPSSSLDDCRSSKLFFGTVKFENDHVAKILGYGDYQIGNVTISRIYYMEGLGHNLFSVRSKDEALYFIIKFLKMIQVRVKVPVRRIRTDNGTEFVNQTLREYYEKVGISHETSVDRSPQQNGVVERRNRTLIEAARTMLIYAKAPLFLWAEAVATVSPEVIALTADVIAPEPAASTDSPSSTTVDQDAPSPSNSQTTPEYVEEDYHDIKVAHMGNDPYFGIPIPEIHSAQSSSSDSIHIIVHPDHQISKHNSKWTKDHPLENIIGELARPVSIRLQLHEQALFCYYDAFLTAIEPKTYKDALTQSC
ncbi:retrovirus-related pol polyprotein from transposon TNT 1-94 [Tanacetum coccineum]|uniref:Retrovirus-related pol polyprotein from transposon TNT 1-94 n=1 Tax=Tanacetum coccineum TaxID=301880 RepID=A0ABQ4XDZ8_9ASTR